MKRSIFPLNVLSLQKIGIMELKDKLKTRIDRLDPYELRIVKILIDSLSVKKTNQKSDESLESVYFQEVIELLGTNGLSSLDINLGREERI